MAVALLPAVNPAILILDEPKFCQDPDQWLIDHPKTADRSLIYKFMTPRPAISVIIPVYNTDQFLSECIQSILDQDFQDIEIILIDDGSTDNCPEIIQRYADQHENITALRQENQGQGVARNLGLAAARGEYITFVDSDDLVPPTAYSSMHSMAVQNNSDMVVGIQQSFNKTRVWRNVPIHRKYFTERIDKTTLSKSSYLLGDISCCNRIIRHEIIKKHRLRFPAASREDLDFTVQAYLHSTTISILPHVVYHYRGRTCSDTATITISYFQDWIDIVTRLHQLFENLHKEDLYTVLLCTEMQKLVVQSRFSRILTNTTYAERREIFQLLSTLAQKLKAEEISESGIFSLREQVRIFLLQHREYDCLEIFEKNPWNPGFLSFLQNQESFTEVTAPLLKIYLQEISSLNRRLQDKSHSASSFGPLKYFSKLHRRWQLLVRRKQKAKIPLAALLYYFALYPIAWIQEKFTGSRNIWLIDERLSRSAEDNSFFLFQYLRTQYPEFKVYYVISANSPDRQRVEKLGRVIHRYSATHAWYLLQAKVLLSTDSLRSLAFPAAVFRRLWSRTHNVFLQHGVMALKRTVYSRKNYFYLSQIITSSNREKQIFIQDYGFRDEQVSVTGLPRFDNLLSHLNKGEKKQILVVPTWRLGLNTPQQVKASKYFWAWTQLLTSPELSDLLDQYHASLIFRPHQNMMPLLADIAVTSKRIHFQQEDRPPLFSLIQESCLLVTDYSSILFDFLYQYKPAVCYMFDRAEMEYRQGGKSHIDIEKELPADIHTTAAGTIQGLAACLQNGCRMSDEHRKRAAVFFRHRDTNNCERIYRAVTRSIEAQP